MVEPAPHLPPFGRSSMPDQSDRSAEREPVELEPGALAQLRALDPDGKHGLVGRVLSTYITAAQGLLNQLDQAVQSGDAATVRRVAHTLKSSSACIGALKFAALCADTEASIQSDRPIDFSAVQNLLTRELSGVLRAVRSAQRTQ